MKGKHTGGNRQPAPSLDVAAAAPRGGSLDIRLNTEPKLTTTSPYHGVKEHLATKYITTRL